MKCICVLYGYVHICKEVYIHTCLHIYIDYTCLHIHVEACAYMWRPESDTRWLSASPWCLRKRLSLNLELTHLAGWLAELQGTICPLLELGCPPHWLLTWAPMAECRSLSFSGKDLLAEPSFQSFHHSWSLPDLSSFFACWNMSGQILVLSAIIYPWWIQIF